MREKTEKGDPTWLFTDCLGNSITSMKADSFFFLLNPTLHFLFLFDLLIRVIKFLLRDFFKNCLD